MATRKKTGGRTKGTPNKRTAEAATLAAALSGDAMSPLGVLLAVMRAAVEKGDARLAADVAAKAACYVHPKLSAIELSLEELSDDAVRDAAR